MNLHLQTAVSADHVEHRTRMVVNSDVSKQASIDHRAAMERKGGIERKIGVGARVVFKATGDVFKCVGRLGAPDNAWMLEGGRIVVKDPSFLSICKFKTEGQRWRWECDC